MMHKKKVKGLPTEDVEEGSLALVKDKEYVFTDNKWKAVK